MSDSSRPVAIVTGASRGIGLGIAQALVARGDRVCVTARGADTLAEVVASLGGPEHAIGVAGKAHDPVHQDAAVTATLEAFGRVDMLVNNAGINPVYGPLLELDLDAGRKILEVNLLAALAWTQRVHKAWMGEHGGAIVNVSSLAGARPAQGIGFYGVSKAALTHLTAQLASELGRGYGSTRSRRPWSRRRSRPRCTRAARPRSRRPIRWAGSACPRTWPARWRSCCPSRRGGSPGRRC